MSINITYNKVIDLFKQWSISKAPIINDFGYGPIWDIGSSEQMKFPYLWIDHQTTSNISMANRNITPNYSFIALFVDQINDERNTTNDNGNNSNNVADIMSDQFQTMLDFINDLVVVFKPLGIKIDEDTISYDKMYDETTDKVCGWILNFNLTINHLLCASTFIPQSNCEPVKISNSDNSFNKVLQSGQTYELPNINVNINNGQTISKPSNIDLDFNNYVYMPKKTGFRTPLLPENIVNPNTQIGFFDVVDVTATFGVLKKETGSNGYKSGARFFVNTNYDFEVSFKFTEGISSSTNVGFRFMDIPGYTNTANNQFFMFANGSINTGSKNVGSISIPGGSEIRMRIGTGQYSIYINNVLKYTYNNVFMDSFTRGAIIMCFGLYQMNDEITDIRLTYL